MNIQQDILSSPIAVQAIDANSIIVAGHRFHASLLFGSRVKPVEWPAEQTVSLDDAARSLITHFRELGGVILLGTGSRLVFPSVAVRREWIQAGLTVEVMDTGAACRTFNLLVGEGREAHAAVILGQPWPDA